MDDPGAMTPEAEALAGAEAVLITHQHFDHLDPDRLRAAAVKAVGEKHHLSHPDVPPVDNVGFLVDGEVFHPGDALTLVDAPTVLVPGQAPWMTVPDLIAYLRKLSPRRAYAIHDGLLNEWGLRVLDSVLASEATGLGADIRHLTPGESVDL